MSAVLAADSVEFPASVPTGVRTIKIGILGLGQVGQAVARLAPEATRLKRRATASVSPARWCATSTSRGAV